jgi:hypothetical protein
MGTGTHLYSFRVNQERGCKGRQLSMVETVKARATLESKWLDIESVAHAIPF